MTGPAEHILVAPEPLSGAAARGLIERLNAELTELYPDPAHRHFDLDEEQVGDGRGVFLVARVGGEPVGCGALRRLDASTGEIKRMFVAPEARRLGVARGVLAELEAHALRLGFRRVVLETGIHQEAAIRLYEGAGYARVPPFGEYLKSSASVCMEKPLDPP